MTKPDQTLHEAMSEMHVCRNILLDQINSIKNLCDDKEKGHVSNVMLFCLVGVKVAPIHLRWKEHLR